MGINIDIYAPQTMGAVVRQLLPAKTFLKDTFFPNILTFPTQSVLVDYSKDKRVMAPFIGQGRGGSNVEMEGFETREFTPTNIAPQNTVDVERLQSRIMGEPLFGGLTPAQRAATKLGNNLRILDDMITRREEWMCAKLLFTGKIPIVGDGINTTFDIGFTNKEVLTGTALWSDPSSDPIGYLQDLEEKIHESSGLNVDRCIMSRDVAKAFLNNTDVRDLFKSWNIVAGNFIPKDLPNGVKYIGHLNNPNIDIYIYDEWVIDEVASKVSGKTVMNPLVPKGTLLLGSGNMEGTILYGAVTLMDVETSEPVTFEGKRVPDSWITKNPDARFLRLQSKPLPVPNYFDGWFVSQVLATS